MDCPIDAFIIWGGDFNFLFDIDLEASGGNPRLKIWSIETIREIMIDLDLCDIWRVRNPDTKTLLGAVMCKVNAVFQMLRYIEDSTTLLYPTNSSPT